MQKLRGCDFLMEYLWKFEGKLFFYTPLQLFQLIKNFLDIVFDHLLPNKIVEIQENLYERFFLVLRSHRVFFKNN